MSAVECLEHKWLNESIQPLKSSKIDSTTTIIPTDSRTKICRREPKLESNKSREIDNIVTDSPPKTSTGFFLHQSPKNGTALDEVLFSSLNNGFNTTANSNASKLNGIDHHHHSQQQHHLQNNHSVNTDCPKQSTTGNNSCSMNPNDTSDLLKDYATNKENINLSKILANRIAPQSSANQMINNLVTLHNNTSISSNTTLYADDSSSNTNTSTTTNVNNNNISSVLTNVQQSLTLPSNACAVQSKHESILFPDAPTTPKVLRKSNQSDTDTPSCVALVKQFQLNNGSLSNHCIDFDEISVNETKAYTQQSPNRSKFANLSEREILPSYRLSATAITTSTTNGHHSIGSSTLSINTLTESSVGVTQQHSNSTLTMNCLCGADKTANCCCNSSSRAALNYRKKSLAVVDSSILC